MTIRINSVCKLGKSFSVKSEKDSDKTEITVAHLKFSELFIDRETMDAIAGFPSGWAARSFFDDTGAPLKPLTINLEKRLLSCTGRVMGPDQNPSLSLVQADLGNIALTLVMHGAHLSGEFAWVARGDEVEDLTELLNKLCSAELELRDAGQADLFRGAA